MDKINHGFYSSAIEFMDQSNNLMTVTGERHHDCIAEIAKMGLTEYYKKWHEDGFMCLIDSIPVFISREEATEMAKEMGISMRGSVLTSEDLW